MMENVLFHLGIFQVGIEHGGISFAGRQLARTRPLRDLEYQTLVARLVQLREAAGLTQVDASRQLGRAPSYVTKVENLYRRVDMLELRELLTLYHGDANALLLAPWTREEGRIMHEERRAQAALEQRVAAVEERMAARRTPPR